MCNFCTCDGECIEWLVEQVKVLAARVTALEVRIVPLEGASQHYVLHEYWGNSKLTNRDDEGVDYVIPDDATARDCAIASESVLRRDWEYPEGGDPGLLLREGDDV